MRSIQGLLHEHCLPAGDELCRHRDRALELYVAHRALAKRDLALVKGAAFSASLGQRPRIRGTPKQRRR
jgi:hypothetical protein